MIMPDWLRDTLLALGAFIGGRAVNGINEQMKEGREMRRGFDRLTIAVEGISSDIRDVRAEIHGQVEGLREELHNHIKQQQRHVEGLENRIDATAARIDAMSTRVMDLPKAYQESRLRLNQEMGCYRPAEPRHGSEET